MSIDDTLLYRHVADQLKGLRVGKKMTQTELAGRVGMARTTIANIEAGLQHPPLHVLYALCSALDAEPIKLLPPVSRVAQTELIEVEIAGQTHTVTPKSQQFLSSIGSKGERT